ncbi:MAG: hypothetical protein ABI467_16660, partial [Kofleriaceae bacterium]
GTGTVDKDGVCTPDGTGSICGDGTTLDASSGSCVPSDSVCGGGTVLVNGTCQDPTAGLHIDLEEGPEPNGFDPGSSPAGTIALKPIGDADGFVVHGCVKPTQDFADLDDYKLTVAAPTLIDITADGVLGLAAGFVTLGNANDAQVGSYQRFGINLANDMSHREIYLPKAGTYDFVMSDTRSLLGLVDGATDYLEPAGNPDGTSCYYVTLKQEAIPTPSTLAVPGGATGTFDNKVKFYSAQMPNGFINLTETVDSPHAAPAFSVIVSNSLLTLDAQGDALFGGIKSTDQTVVVADFVYNYAFQPVNYALAFGAASSADALPTDGTTLNTTIHGSSFGYPDFTTVNQFYFDAAAANQIIGMDLALSKGMTGVIADATGTFYGTFGGLGGTATFTAYKGLWRAPAAGRYYFIVYDPTAADTGAALAVTSTLTTIAPGALAVGTPVTAQANNAFNSNPYTLDLTNNIWDSFTASGTNTGNLGVTVFDPTTAFGRLDNLVLSSGNSAGTAPVLSLNFAAAGATKGYITKVLGQTNVLLKVTPANPTGTPAFALDVEPRTYTDLGAIVAPHTTATNGETAAANVAHRYYFTTAPGNVVTITAHPTTTAQDPILEALNPNESVAHGGNGAAAGADEVITFTQDPSGFTAFQVREAAGAAQTYDLTVDVELPYYSKHAGTTTYADACMGGTVIPLTATSASYAADDEGLSAPIAVPAGFTFFGNATTQFVLGSNGFISFNTSLTSALPGAHVMPDGIGKANISAFWSDLENVVICTKTVGTKFVIQWTGDEYSSGQGIAFQTILDPTDNSIEFVYGAGQAANGTADPGSAGVQNTGGTQGTSTGDGSVAGFAAANSAVKLTHP